MLFIKRINFNSPIILGLTFFSFLTLIWSYYVGNIVFHKFGIYYTFWTDWKMYARMFSHILAHKDMSHFVNNFMIILIVGPIVEEKYGSLSLFCMIALTALMTGLIQVYYFKGIVLIGASGIVFMLILLASFSNTKEGKIPLTVILVAIFYLGNEVVDGVLVTNNISEMSHIIGGLCGAVFGFILNQR